MKTTHGSILLSLILVVSFGITPAFATPVTIGFDGANGPFTGPADEDGFTYSLFSGDLFRWIVAGNPPPEMEATVVANGEGILKIVSSTLNEAFNWLGFDIAEWDSNNLDQNPIIVEGFLNGISVGSELFTPDQAAGQGPYSTKTAAGSLLGTTIDELRITLLADSTNSGFFFQRTDNIVLDKMITPPNQPIPEPGTIFLISSGLAGLAAWRYRKKHVKA